MDYDTTETTAMYEMKFRRGWNTETVAIRRPWGKNVMPTLSQLGNSKGEK